MTEPIPAEEFERRWNEILARPDVQECIRDLVVAIAGMERPCQFCGATYRCRFTLELHEKCCDLRPRFYTLKTRLNRLLSVFGRHQ